MFGIPCRVTPWFWGVSAFMGWGLSRQPALLAIWVACVFASILVHKLGHALVARLLGASDVRVVLYEMGGLAIHTGRMGRLSRAAIALAGPGAGFLLFGAVYAGLHYGPPHLDPRLARASSFLVWINLVWGAVNLLPVYPLDGGQVAQQLLGRKLGAILSVVVGVGVAGGLLWLHSQGRGYGLYPSLLFGYCAFVSFGLLRNG